MNCVHSASSVEQADIVVAWLSDQGIAAFVKNRNLAAESVGLPVPPRGIEICVADAQEATKAKDLLRTHLESIKSRHGATPDKVIHVLCGECGKRVEFPGELFGTVQTCPSCGRNVDVGEEAHYC